MTNSLSRNVAVIIIAIVLTFAAIVGPLASVVGATGGIQHLPVGWVLSQQNVPLPEFLSSVATAKRVVYVSKDLDGTKVPVSGLIFTPHDPQNNARTVAWGHGTVGIGDSCAPSTNSQTFYPEAAAAIKTYLNKGWTVTATDYQGLGTPGDHPYLVGEAAARSMIDSVRAARRLDDNVSRKWAATGHSQGGQAALFAGEIANTYGFGLDLTAVVGIAPASNLDILGSVIPGTEGNGYLVMAILGVASVDPSVDPQAIFTEETLNRIEQLDSTCGDLAILGLFGDLTAEQLLVGGALSENVLASVAVHNPGQVQSSAPIRLVNGTDDVVIPVELTQLLHAQVCGAGSSSYLDVIDGADHITSVFQSLFSVRAFVNATFWNLNVPSNC